jgi:hypothetical protein
VWNILHSNKYLQYYAQNVQRNACISFVYCSSLLYNFNTDLSMSTDCIETPWCKISWQSVLNSLVSAYSWIRYRFFGHKRIISAVNRVEFVSDRMLYIILRGCWCHIIVLNVHAHSYQIKRNKLNCSSCRIQVT